MSKPTPGPWIATKEDGDEWWFGGADGAQIRIESATDRSIAVIGASYSIDGRADADARLIAAAPLMLEALEKIVDRDLTYFNGRVMGDQIDWAAITHARAAIKAARGDA